eukprot:jgi/Psemu1/311527/fgenesh1_kg.787_\
MNENNNVCTDQTIHRCGRSRKTEEKTSSRWRENTVPTSEAEPSHRHGQPFSPTKASFSVTAHLTMGKPPGATEMSDW